MKLLRTAALCAATVGMSGQSPAPKYAQGQVWEYHTRPQDAGSSIKIQKIGSDGTNKTYHISIIGTHFRTAGFAGVLPYIPVSDSTLDASVIRLSTAKAEFPTTALDEGIAEWQRARGGVFTIPIAQILDIIDQQVAQAQATPPAPSSNP